MKYIFTVMFVSISVGCNRGDELGEGVTHEVMIGNYEGFPNVRREVYRRELLPLKAQGFYENGAVFYKTFYMPIDSFMMITTQTYYPSGALKSMDLSQAKIDTFTFTSIEGKVIRSIRFPRDYFVHILRFYENGKIQMRYGLNNFDTAKAVEYWSNSGIKQSEVAYKYTMRDTVRSIEWDSLGNQIHKANNSHLNFPKKGAP